MNYMNETKTLINERERRLPRWIQAATGDSSLFSNWKTAPRSLLKLSILSKFNFAQSLNGLSLANIFQNDNTNFCSILKGSPNDKNGNQHISLRQSRCCQERTKIRNNIRSIMHLLCHHTLSCILGFALSMQQLYRVQDADVSSRTKNRYTCNRKGCIKLKLVFFLFCSVSQSCN